MAAPESTQEAHAGVGVCVDFASSHPLCCRVSVCCVTDLQHVENHLRRLYATANGQMCQALLTTEYCDWKRSVSSELASRDCAGPCSEAASNIARRRVPPSPDGNKRQLFRTIEAFLPVHYHLVYACHSVDIYRTLPTVPANRGEKRTRCS